MNLTELCHIAHQDNIAKGFWENPRTDVESIMLAVCELSEAVEEIRKDSLALYYEGRKPCGVISELADCVIRIADLCGRHAWDLEKIVEDKLLYNRSRSYKHGKNF